MTCVQNLLVGIRVVLMSSSNTDEHNNYWENCRMNAKWCNNIIWDSIHNTELNLSKLEYTFINVMLLVHEKCSWLVQTP